MVANIRVKRKRNINLPKRIDGPKTVKVGFPSGKVSGDIVQIAIYNHYGTRGGASGGGWGGPIPARPFLLNAIRSNKSKYESALKTSAAKILRGDAELVTVLRKLGIVAQGDIQQEIVDLRTPPNSPVTIRMKGSSNPLIASGRMRQSVTYEVAK